MAQKLLEYDRSQFKKWANDDELVKQFFDARKRLPQKEADLGYWVNPKNGRKPDDLRKFLQNYQSKSQKKSKEKREGAETVFDDNNWQVIRLDTYEAARYYGEGSTWCMTGRYSGMESQGQYYFNNYLRNGGYAQYTKYYIVISKHPVDKATS